MLYGGIRMLYVIQILLSVFLVWSFLVAVLGTFAKVREAKGKAAVANFNYAVVICAHNEAAVISNLLTCLQVQTYPQDKFHTFLLADHCTDETAALGRKFARVTVWERTEGLRSGKGAVLNWGIEKIRRECPDQFDNLVVFDADNVVGKDFLAIINQNFANGAEIVTGKRVAQNPFASLVSQWYTLYWCIINGLYNRPRFKLGLSSMLSGTGFAFRLNLLGDKGWKTISLSEDIEFSCQQVLKGHKVDFIETALFYDEQPTDFKVMAVQLSRWCTGGYQIVKAYFHTWLSLYCRQPSLRLLDLFMALGFTVILGVVAIFYILLALGLLVEGNIGILLAPAIFMYLATCTVGLAAANIDGWPVRKLWAGILTFPVFYVTLSLVSLWALFFPQREWVNIVHKGTPDLQSQVKLKVTR
jgi:cellulose synthase/poly-beta-1,6-N-acetylglucosamine synthase-like glycosyltransferase